MHLFLLQGNTTSVSSIFISSSLHRTLSSMSSYAWTQSLRCKASLIMPALIATVNLHIALYWSVQYLRPSRDKCLTPKSPTLQINAIFDITYIYFAHSTKKRFYLQLWGRNLGRKVKCAFRFRRPMGHRPLLVICPPKLGAKLRWKSTSFRLCLTGPVPLVS